MAGDRCGDGDPIGRGSAAIGQAPRAPRDGAVHGDLGPPVGEQSASRLRASSVMARSNPPPGSGHGELSPRGRGERGFSRRGLADRRFPPRGGEDRDFRWPATPSRAVGAQAGRAGRLSSRGQGRAWVSRRSGQIVVRVRRLLAGLARPRRRDLNQDPGPAGVRAQGRCLLPPTRDEPRGRRSVLRDHDLGAGFGDFIHKLQAKRPELPRRDEPARRPASFLHARRPVSRSPRRPPQDRSWDRSRDLPGPGGRRNDLPPGSLPWKPIGPYLIA